MGITIRPEKRNMRCVARLLDGAACGKLGMYHAGNDGFCFDHKDEARVATAKLKRIYLSDLSVKQEFSRQAALHSRDSMGPRNMQNKS